MRAGSPPQNARWAPLRFSKGEANRIALASYGATDASASADLPTCIGRIGDAPPNVRVPLTYTLDPLILRSARHATGIAHRPHSRNART